MIHINRTIAAAFILSSTVAGTATITVREASAKNLRAAAAACLPRHQGYFNDTTSEEYDGADFIADDDSGQSELICAIPEFSDWNRQVVTEVTVVLFDNTASDSVFTQACRSNYLSTTDSCGSSTGSGSNSQTPGWDSYFPAVSGATGVWDDTTLGTAYLFVFAGEGCIFDGYLLKDATG